MLTYAEALREATSIFKTRSSTPRLDAELLLVDICGISRTHLLAEWDTLLSPAQTERFHVTVGRRAAGEPIAYVLGTKEFYGRSFIVDRRVLVPRPETELLVEHALDWARHRAGRLDVADIGTGSGCIAITLALELPLARITAVDVSPDALDVARLNITRYALEDRIDLLLGDGLAPLHDKVELLVTNPPYMTLERVDPDVRQWEPHLALEGHGPDGLELPRRLIETAPRYLAPRAAFFMEIADWQGPAVLSLAREAFQRADVQVYQDLAGKDRLLTIKDYATGNLPLA